MISVIITTKKEPETLPRAIEAIIKENIVDLEVLVVGPDEETKKIVAQFPQVKFIKDAGLGKPAALNLAFQQAQGNILILTDGDVWIEAGSIKKLLEPFIKEKIGAVTGRPMAINSRKNIFGYWAHFLTDAADQTRRKKSKRGEYLVCSGYLYAFRNVIKEIPNNTLVEDGIISQMIWQNSYKMAYQPEAMVNVKFPTNFSDWLKQKVRSTGGYVQKVHANNDKLIMPQDKMRGFTQELGDGLKLFFTYPKSLKEFFWTKLLYLARLYLWLLIFIRIKILKKYSWPRVESTK
jgi:cellulose synthase/poly-beta-1,6-N-acetylglucosamine synthase-like glycosyltransferase